MRSLDRAAIDDLSIPGLVLMENAGRAFVDVLGERAGPLHGSRVVVVAGKGNNGGDGFVIAMAQVGYERRPGESDEAFWERAVADVFAYWKP